MSKRYGGVCPVDTILASPVFGVPPDKRHCGDRELILAGPTGTFLCEKCRALFYPEKEETDGPSHDSHTDRSGPDRD